MSNQRVSSHSSFSSFNWNYDVFLSFRGEDTRINFTSHLCGALKERGFNVFMDDKNIETGKPISLQLLNAIEHSTILVIVISRNFISSSWCLNELVKIVECMNTRRQMVIPIFYEVKPLAVISNFEQEVFARHEETSEEDMEKVEKWRNALKEVANIAGLGLEDYGNEKDYVDRIVDEISSKLSSSRNEAHLVESTMEELSSGLRSSRNEADFVDGIVEEISSGLRSSTLLIYLNSYLDEVANGFNGSHPLMLSSCPSVPPFSFFIFFFNLSFTSCFVVLLGISDFKSLNHVKGC